MAGSLLGAAPAVVAAALMLLTVCALGAGAAPSARSGASSGVSAALHSLGPSTVSNPNGELGAFFGWSVAVSGSKMAVSAAGENISGVFEVGQVDLFKTKGTLITTLNTPNPIAGGVFGYSVAMSGSLVAVGAPGESVGGDVEAGHVYVYTTAGHLLSTLTSPNEAADGEFGYAVAVSGSTVVVGAPGESVNGLGLAGHAYVFKATGSLVATLASPAALYYGQADGYFGLSVGVSGSTVVVGAPYENATGAPSTGHVYVYKGKTGTLLATLTDPAPQTNEVFGLRVAVSGKTIVVGAPTASVSGDDAAGHAFLFLTSGLLVATLTSPNLAPYGYFGASVAISGRSVVVGAYGETVSALSGAGRAYTFSSTGAPVGTLTSPNAQADGDYGQSVAASGRTVLVGAPQESDSGLEDAGHAYLT